MKKIVLFLTALCLCLSCNQQKTFDNSTVNTFELNRFLGDWYEIARYDHKFERGLDFCKANYSLREDGKIAVTNTGIKGEKMRTTKGRAKTTDEEGLLRVSFFRPFYSDYRVLLIDEEYQYALIGGHKDKYLWILSRTPQLDDDVKVLILAEAAQRGYDVSKFIWVKQ